MVARHHAISAAAGWAHQHLGLPAAIWLTVAGLMLPLLAVTGIGLLVDPRLLGEQSVWAKPTKFQAAVILHFLTLGIVASRFSPTIRSSRLLLTTAILSAGAALAEIGYILAQAARQLPSHFNTATPLDAQMFSLMAVGAALVTGAAGVVGLLAAADANARLGVALRWAVVIGLVAGTILTLLTAFRLGANMSHHVGFHPPGGAMMPVTGWSLTARDLRVPHFLATHMMQIVPLVGVVAQRLLPGRSGLWLVVAVAILWTGLTLTQFRLALSGQPFLLL